jgi:hypothetical protein
MVLSTNEKPIWQDATKRNGSPSYANAPAGKHLETDAIGRNGSHP